MRTKSIFDEIKRNLLGAFETALFMPIARKRFGDTKEEALRSFLVPIILFPFTMLMVYLSPKAGGAEAANAMAVMYGLRMVIVWAFFFGAVYWIAKGFDRNKHFMQFVTASNWLAVPATVTFLPVFWMLLNGTHTWVELTPFMMCLMAYTYAFTAFMAAYVLRICFELAGFIVFLGVVANNSTHEIIFWAASKIL